MRSFAVVLAALAASPAAACTLCHSRLAGLVRAEVFGADFLGNLAAVAAPMPLLVAIVLAAR